MATTTQSAGKRGYVDFDEYIDFQLQKTRAGIKATDILTALAGVATLFLAYLLVFVVFDHWVIAGGFGTVGRWLMLGGLAAGCIAWVVWKVVIPARMHVTGLYAAKAIEQTEPGLKHTLLNLVDLRRAGRDVSEEIRTAMEKRAAVTLSQGDVDAAVDHRPLMRLSLLLLGLVVVCCLYSLFSPKKISASVLRALLPASDTVVDTSYKIDKVAIRIDTFRLDAQNGRAQRRTEDLKPDAVLEAGSKPQVVVDLSYDGDPPENVMLYYSTQDEKYRDVPVPMKRDPNERKRYVIRLTGETNRGILQNTTYRIEAGDAKAGPFAITVVRPPIASVRSVRYVYPNYMEREPLTQDGGLVDAWEGTQVTVNAVTDRPVREAWLVFTDGEDVNTPVDRRRMRIAEGTKLSLTLKAVGFRADGSYPHFYHIRAVGKRGLRDPSPALYGMTIRRDLPPEIRLLDPKGNDRDVPANTETLPLLFQARDPDFKLANVTLRAELTRANALEPEPQEHAVQLFRGSRKSLQAARNWDLKPMRLKVGDRVRFRLEARDNKPPAGNRGFTRWVTLRIVEPVSKDELKRRQQEDRQRQEQIQQQQDNDQDGRKRGKQPQDEANKGKGGDEPQNNDKQGDGKTQRKNGQGKGKQPIGGMGDPKAGKGDQQQGDPQPKNGGPQGDRRDPDGQRQSGQNEPPPKDDQERFNKLIRDGQKKPQDGQKNGQPNKQPKGNEQQPGREPKQGTEPMPGDKDGQKKDGTQPDAGMGKQPSKGTDPTSPRNPDGSKGPGEQPKTGKKPSPKKGEGGTGAGPNQPKGMNDGQKTKGKSGAQGKPNGNKTDRTQDGGKSNQPGRKDKPKNGDGKTKRQTGDADGPRKNVNDDGTPAKKKIADGTETGAADPDKNSNANPTPAKNPDKIKPRDGTKPVKKRGTGDPMNTGKKNSSKNPGNAKSKPTGTKVPENPDDKTTKPKTTDGKPDKTTNKRATPGNEPLKNTDGKSDRKSKKPTGGGETGRGKPNDQGKTGSQQNGAGDTSSKPGSRQDGMGKRTGQPGSKSGMGSTTRPKGGKSGGMTGTNGNNASSKQSGGGKGGKQPGNSSGVPNGNPPQGNGKRGRAGGVGNPGNAVNNSTPPPPTGEQADLELGKKAMNLQLNRLEDRLTRGKMTRKQLKELGFDSEQDGFDFLKRTRRRMNDPNDLQMRETLKSIPHFQSGLTKRSGAKVKADGLQGVGTTGRSEAPPHLRNYTRAFKNSVRRGR